MPRKRIRSAITKYLFGDLERRQRALVGMILGAGLMVNLAAGRVEKILELAPKCDGLNIVLQFGGLFVAGGFGLFFGARAFRGATAHRLLRAQEREEAADVLILPVSRPRRDKRSNFYGGGLLGKVKELAERGQVADTNVGIGGHDPELATRDLLTYFTCPGLWIGDRTAEENRFSAFSWTVGFKTIDFLLKSSKGRLRAIHLLPSGDTFGEADAYYRPTIEALLNGRIAPRKVNDAVDKENWMRTQPSEDSFDLILHKGIDYDKFDVVQQEIQKILDGESKRSGGASCMIAIDVTGGSSAFSGAAAIESTRRDVVYCYLGDKLKDDGTLEDPKSYNVVAESVSGG